MSLVKKVEMVPNGPKLSELIQGYYRMTDWGVDSQALLKFINQHIEFGISTVDHAHIYGDPSCEEIFGRALKLDKSIRSKIEIITKYGIVKAGKSKSGINYYNSQKEEIIKSVETSLTRLGTDHVDALLVHRPDLLLNADEVAEAFNELKQQGKVKYFGVSNFTVSQFNLLQSRLDEPLITNQIEINPVNLWALEDGTLDQAQMQKTRPMAWSLMAGGRLFNVISDKNIRLLSTLNCIANEIGADSIDQVIFAWVRKLPANPVAIIGSGKIERVKAAVDSLRFNLTHEQWYRVWTASKGHTVA